LQLQVWKDACTADAEVKLAVIVIVAAMHFDIPSELEFWCSASWVELWAGAPLQIPQPGSAAGLVQAALVPGINVGFPEITEICERIAAEPDETAEAVDLLVRAVRDSYAPLQKKLKALTISNELMYEGARADIFAAFCSTDGLHEALVTLRNEKENMDLGARAVEICRNIRMFATEIDKKCFLENGTAIHKRQARRVSSSAKSNSEAAGNVPRNVHSSVALEPRGDVVQDRQLQAPLLSPPLPPTSKSVGPPPAVNGVKLAGGVQPVKPALPSPPAPAASPPNHPFGTIEPPLQPPPVPTASPPTHPFNTVGPPHSAVSSIEAAGSAQLMQPPLPSPPLPSAYLPTPPPTNLFSNVGPPLSLVSGAQTASEALSLQPPMLSPPVPAVSPPAHPWGSSGPPHSAVSSVQMVGNAQPPLPLTSAPAVALPTHQLCTFEPAVEAVSGTELAGSARSEVPTGLPHVPADATPCPVQETSPSHSPTLTAQVGLFELGTAPNQPPRSMVDLPVTSGAVDAAFSLQPADTAQAQKSGDKGEGGGLDSLFD